jgi:biopolymer transport protein ExbB
MSETLELRLGEAVMEEVPRINKHLPLLKIIAAVAPLLGLLGTVTGMIVTFQAITLFGAGDPRLMAGGISQALITTVLGLCVAIPMLLLHNIVHGRARHITEILQQRAVALVAERAEKSQPQPGGARHERMMSVLIDQLLSLAGRSAGARGADSRSSFS